MRWRRPRGKVHTYSNPRKPRQNLSLSWCIPHKFLKTHRGFIKFRPRTVGWLLFCANSGIRTISRNENIGQIVAFRHSLGFMLDSFKLKCLAELERMLWISFVAKRSTVTATSVDVRKNSPVVPEIPKSPPVLTMVKTTKVSFSQQLPYSVLSNKEFGRATDRDYHRKPAPKVIDMRPNYFVALPITNQEIVDGIFQVQAHMLNENPLLEQVLISPGTLHLTLMVMHLDEEHCLHDAKNAIEKVIRRVSVQQQLRPINLKFEGISTFKDEVLFANIRRDRDFGKLCRLSEIVRDSFESEEIYSTDGRAFNPHLTIAKMSKVRDRNVGRKLRKFDRRMYKPFVETVFGVQEINEIQVCSMMKKKQESGYFYAPIEMELFE